MMEILKNETYEVGQERVIAQPSKSGEIKRVFLEEQVQAEDGLLVTQKSTVFCTEEEYSALSKKINNIKKA